MADNTDKRVTVVTRDGKDTGMGAEHHTRLYSLRQQKRLEPRRVSSTTGNHWTDRWALLPGKYLAVVTEVSNGGIHKCRCECLHVDRQDGSAKIEPWNGGLPLWVPREEVCSCLAPLEVSF